MNHTQDTFTNKRVQTTHGHTLENALKKASTPNGYAMPLAEYVDLIISILLVTNT